MAGSGKRSYKEALLGHSADPDKAFFQVRPMDDAWEVASQARCMLQYEWVCCCYKLSVDGMRTDVTQSHHASLLCRQPLLPAAAAAARRARTGFVLRSCSLWA